MLRCIRGRSQVLEAQIETSAAGGKAQPVGPVQAQKGSRTGKQTERRRPSQQALAGGYAGAGGAWRAVAAGEGGARPRAWAWPDGPGLH